MKILLITPPFTQLNTPYPATAYLKPILEREGYNVRQIDLGNLTARRIFSFSGLIRLFDDLETRYSRGEYAGLDRFFSLRDVYLSTIDAVASFLKGTNDSASYLINRPGWLPEGERLEAARPGKSFDDARHRATLYLEEISDIITAYCDSSYGFSRYAERIALSPPSFEPVEAELKKPLSLIRILSREILREILEYEKPDLCGFSVPFPGNLLGALDGASFIKENYSEITTVMGGGYVNTELRELDSPALFRYMDFVTLDDGERPFINICRYIKKQISLSDLARTYVLSDEECVCYIEGSDKDYRQCDLPAPDYSGLLEEPYFSLLPFSNPMHRLWSDGKWVKMTLAHGCYWHRCAFCDTSLDYIKRFDSDKASSLADKIEQLIEKTGLRSFHFVDEAAPPSLLKSLAIELIRRKISISWWTNIRFEKSFTADLCRLLAASGCIAVSGGLEVASDRMLELMDKGMTVSRAASVADSFHSAGIMVHAYLMYGFPGQTVQEIIDALENVRQLFREKLLDSAFWHQFALTAHSPVGGNPDRFGINITGPRHAGFARNDLEYTEGREYDPDQFAEGLSAAVRSYMTEQGLDLPVGKWFPFRTPKPRPKRDSIGRAVEAGRNTREIDDHSRFIWIGGNPLWNGSQMEIHDTDGAERIFMKKKDWIFLSELLKICHIRDHGGVTTGELEDFCRESDRDLSELLRSDLFRLFSTYGLLII
ncbi:MAG: radical SAM protein [Spirochaetales bacterium]|nr:radical SAM protein [Spirochaetales bacterium]